MLPKIVLTDIDGVWTDAGMYYDETGNELKKFNTYDSAGVLFCKLLNIPVGIVTGESTISVKRRAEKLKIPILKQGVKDKGKVINELLITYGLGWEELAYVGDDINDYAILKHAGFSACPSSSPSYIKEVVDLVLAKKGGEGVFREFIEVILKQNKINVVDLLHKSGTLSKFLQ